ncbi:hypothetical protein EHF33_07425 [Deinococcus psychrotolerans]|uniref:Uncharacterized protein n=2 Tax=Deinococcus TaxID=1298 RepID=A0A553UU17_9DEIO|nr:MULTISPECIES: hypothetical protein [Deinococcus]AZI42594.1 hypothetical protein EHF33_07425 [Deinococcus psychrotolerans]TSA83694.1 hypothetical protein FNU79_11835 [Deinococcus detaillensis]
MTDRNERTDGRLGEVVDEGTTPELLEEKNIAEDLLRADVKADRKNPNDQPGFDDGRLGGFDYEDRQGQPNDEGEGSDAAGKEEGGIGTERNGGVDGGPARTHPLPGKDGK